MSVLQASRLRSRVRQLGFAAAAAVSGACLAVAADSESSPVKERADAMAYIAGGEYTPLIRSERELERVPVAPFMIDTLPVTNADFLAFVTARPEWRRSRVSRLFADESYLGHWEGDMAPGPRAPDGAPVVRVSWFAARAYARWAGKRLPSTAEWELVAAAGYSSPDGRAETELAGDVYKWLARPVPEVLPVAAAARPNFHGVRGMHGLVWEWVDDFNTSMVTGESRADSGLERDLFCGAGAVGAKETSDYAAFMRMALRASLRASNTTTSLGFRCAKDFRPVKERVTP